MKHVALFGNDFWSKYAMKVLKIVYDKSYTYCEDCDWLVVKAADCCLNKANSCDIELIDHEITKTHEIYTYEWELKLDDLKK